MFWITISLYCYGFIQFLFLENNENCKPPPEIANGAVVDGLLASYTTGSSVEYRCNEYYLLRGSKASHCEQGKWSSPPVCLGKQQYI